MQTQINALLSRMPAEEVVHFLARIIDSVPLTIACLDGNDDFRSIVLNGAAQDQFGKSEAEMLGTNEFDIASPNNARKMRETNMAALQGQKTLITEDEFPGATHGETELRKWKVPITDSSGTKRYLLIIAEDISAEKRLQRSEKEHARRLRSIANNAPGMIYQFRRSPEGKFSFPYVSDKTLQFFGLSSEQLFGDATLIIDLIHPHDRPYFDETIVRSVERVQAWHWEGRFLTPKGVRWIRGGSQPTKFDDGSILWDGLFIDITEQMEAESLILQQQEQLIEASKLAALGELAGGIAHEINTPLNSIILAADIARERLEFGDVDAGNLNLQQIQETTERIGTIIKGMKRVCRDGSKDFFENVDLRSIIEQTLSLCQAKFVQAGIDLAIDVEEGLCVHGRSVQLSQVLLNLLHNAYDAVKGQLNSQVTVSARKTDRRIELEIIDSGPQIPEPIREKLFRPFFTTKASGQGTGLGLSISKKIIEEHGGSLALDRTSATTRFTIRLQAANEDSQEERPSQRKSIA